MEGAELIAHANCDEDRNGDSTRDDDSIQGSFSVNVCHFPIATTCKGKLCYGWAIGIEYTKFKNAIEIACVGHVASLSTKTKQPIVKLT